MLSVQTQQRDFNPKYPRRPNLQSWWGDCPLQHVFRTTGCTKALRSEWLAVALVLQPRDQTYNGWRLHTAWAHFARKALMAMMALPKAGPERLWKS